MNKKTQMWIGIGAVAVLGYYFWKQMSKPKSGFANLTASSNCPAGWTVGTVNGRQVCFRDGKYMPMPIHSSLNLSGKHRPKHPKGGSGAYGLPKPKAGAYDTYGSGPYGAGVYGNF